MFTVKNFAAWGAGQNDMKCFEVRSFDILAGEDDIIFRFARQDGSIGQMALVEIGCSRLIVENETGKTITNIEFQKSPAFKNKGEDFYHETTCARLPSGFEWSVTKPNLCAEEKNQPIEGQTP